VVHIECARRIVLIALDRSWSAAVRS